MMDSCLGWDPSKWKCLCRIGVICKEKNICEKVLRDVSRRFQISSRRSRCRRTCERILREHSRRIWKLSRRPFWSKSASWEIKQCEKELAVRSHSSNWGTSARWDCEIKLADFRKITRRPIWVDSARRWCEFNIADFWEISRSPNWRRFARKLCEKRSSRKKICEIVLREHTRSLPWHTSQDRIFWENIWPLDNLREHARRCQKDVTDLTYLPPKEKKPDHFSIISSLVHILSLLIQISKFINQGTLHFSLFSHLQLLLPFILL